MNLKDKAAANLKKAAQDSREKLFQEIESLRNDGSAAAVKRANAMAKQVAETRRKLEMVLREKYSRPNK